MKLDLAVEGMQGPPMANSPTPHPVSQGATRALMDEYMRAAGALCDVVERFGAGNFATPQSSEVPGSASPRGIARHVLRAARGYAADLGRALDADYATRDWPDIETLREPSDLRPQLEAAIRHTEEVARRLETMTPEEILATRFEVPWGQLYDPEILLEHAIVHLLRHRRQLERW